jgi:hypothetical protein
MPIPMLHKLAKEANVSIEVAEQKWEEAKKQVDKQYPNLKKNSNQYWALVTHITKMMLKPKGKVMSKGIFNVRIATEDNDSTQSAHYETELCFIGHMRYPENLNQADRIVEINQHVIRSNSAKVDGGQIRVRKSHEVFPHNEVKYLTTIKQTIYKGSATQSLETNERVSPLFYEQFSMITENSSSKTRYTFKQKDVVIGVLYDGAMESVKVPYIEYEIDVFTIEEQVSSWVKIDIEIDHLMDYLVHYFQDRGKMTAQDLSIDIPLKHLPIGIENAFLNSTTDEKQKAIIAALYDKSIFGFDFTRE